MKKAIKFSRKYKTPEDAEDALYGCKACDNCIIAFLESTNSRDINAPTTVTSIWSGNLSNEAKPAKGGKYIYLISEQA